MNCPRFISSWVYRATVVNFVSLRGLTNHGVNFVSLRGLTNHGVNFLSLRGLTNHGIDATDRLRTIYVRAYHALMASSLQFMNLLLRGTNFNSQGSTTDKPISLGIYSNRSNHIKARVVPRFIIEAPGLCLSVLFVISSTSSRFHLLWSFLGFFGFSHFSMHH